MKVLYADKHFRVLVKSCRALNYKAFSPECQLVTVLSTLKKTEANFNGRFFL